MGTFAKHLIKTRRDGKRVEIPPGERLPDWMPAHDVAELVAIGAAIDVPDEPETIAASAAEAGAAGGASAGTNTTGEGVGAASGDSPDAGTRNASTTAGESAGSTAEAGSESSDTAGAADVTADPASEIPGVEGKTAATPPSPAPEAPAPEAPAKTRAKK